MKKELIFLIIFILLHQYMVGQPFTSIEVFPAKNISSTSALLMARFIPNGTVTAASFYMRRADDEAFWSVISPSNMFESAPGVFEASLTLESLVPNCTYIFTFCVGIENTHFYSGEKHYFTTLDGSRGDAIIIPLTFRDMRNHYRTVQFGLHTYATQCYDLFLGEAEEPPLPPEIEILTSRFYNRCLGGGSLLDIRRFFSTTQIDTYRVTVYARSADYPITVTWPNINSLYNGSVTLKTGSTLIDMKSTTQATITDPDESALRIIAEKPSPIENYLFVATPRGVISSYENYFAEAFVYTDMDSFTSWFEWESGVGETYRTERVVTVAKSAVTKIRDTIFFSPTFTFFNYRAIVENSLGRFTSGTNTQPISSPNYTYQQPEIPSDFNLFQNHPNPFNPSTLINYHLPTGGYTTVKVFDVLGREVATLVNEYKEAGRYEVSFSAVGGGTASGVDTNRLTSGVYFYKLVVSSTGPSSAGSYTSVKKMVLMR
ncbi:MAG: hypothetical protein Q8K98_13290 [Bacteroidota bacterium]|nr:hypothetical protein [Bacteroidota bacterium]